jgi:hypothetical protein
MASPRTRRIRKARAAAARAAAAQPAAPAPAPAPAPVATPEPAPEPVVIDMAPEEKTAEAHVEFDMAGEIDYTGMTKAELCEVLDARGVEYSRYASKANLVELAEG